ncbi:methyl-accepting chemotaxis sensory transducer with Cache sensor [Orenia metallireducens]|uniref:Methyl-accepting chemotaxis sensory transducer with Cache sensor n=1 Tax=Orenia metallireducens TaxID=1413210 RepID=A0A285GNF2_9FIRM|nr:methyl-accepting chemotaxis protein [Orenia metallireducens]PRX29818.1 methyl-accepting chemotaxis sensory transducer with Cache sensor [Orenia metallireducens]SNY25099.1 methyl-accepting chemotaxis sensory transducer with Cache sensor [Orenia metallireducens]
MNKIKSKITLSILLTSLIIALLVGGVTLFNSRGILKEKAEEKVRGLTNIYGMKLDEQIAKTEELVKQLENIVVQNINLEEVANNPVKMDEFEDEIKDTFLGAAEAADAKSGWIIFDSKTVQGGHSLSFVQKDGRFIRADEYDIYQTGHSEGDWWKKAVENGKNSSDPYFWEPYGGTIVSFSKRVEKDGKLLGVIGSDFMFDEFRESYKNKKIYDSGYLIIVNKNFDFLLHPEFEGKNFKEVSNGQLKEVGEQIENSDKKMGTIYYSYEGNEKVMTYYKLLNGWTLVGSIPVKEMFASLRTTTTLIVSLTIIALIFATIFAFWISNKLSNPLVEVTEKFNKMAKGDFTNTISEEITTRKDEIGDLARGFNKTTKSIRVVISSILDSVENLSAHSEELSAASQEGHATTQETNELIRGVSASIEEIIDSTQQVSSFAEESTNQSQTGRENIGETIFSIKEINDVVKQTVSLINDLDNNSEEIGQIIALINDIAQQTNLLALNAAIEAARAGEHGQGFAVVAEEIRELAEETTKATKNISSLVKITQQRSATGLESIKQVELKAEQGEKIAQKAGEIFNKINNTTEKTSTQIQQVAASTQVLGKNSEQIIQSAEDIATMSDEITNSSLELTNMAQNLQSLVSKFKV